MSFFSHESHSPGNENESVVEKAWVGKTASYLQICMSLEGDTGPSCVASLAS